MVNEDRLTRVSLSDLYAFYKEVSFLRSLMLRNKKDKQLLLDTLVECGYKIRPWTDMCGEFRYMGDVSSYSGLFGADAYMAVTPIRGRQCMVIKLNNVSPGKD